MKPGVMFLFPVATIDDKYSFGSAGCQIEEVPSIQLLHLLPDFDGRDGYFHWVPEKVAQDLSLDRGDFASILTKICSDHNMLEEGKRIGEEYYGDFILNPSGTNLVRIVPMDENSKRFYQKYGNLSGEELDNCKSVEINTEDFLEYATDRLKKKLEGRKKDDYYKEKPEEIAKIEKGIINVAEMAGKDVGLGSIQTSAVTRILNESQLKHQVNRSDSLTVATAEIPEVQSSH